MMATKVNVKTRKTDMSTAMPGIVIVAMSRSVVCPVTGAMSMTVMVLGTMTAAVATTVTGTMPAAVAGRMPAAVIGAVAMPMAGASVRISGLQICGRENSESSGNGKDKEELFHDDDGVGFCVELLPQQGGVIIRRSGALPYSSTSNVFCDMQDKGRNQEMKGLHPQHIANHAIARVLVASRNSASTAPTGGSACAPISTFNL